METPWQDALNASIEECLSAPERYRDRDKLIQRRKLETLLLRWANRERDARDVERDMLARDEREADEREAYAMDATRRLADWVR